MPLASAADGVKVAVSVLALYVTVPATALAALTWILVAFTVDVSAADENVIWIVAFVATPVVPEAGVTAVTEKLAGGGGAGAGGLGVVWGGLTLLLLQPVINARNKATEKELMLPKPRRRDIGG